MRKILTFLTFLFPLATLAQPGFAQHWESYSDHRGRGAFVCPVNNRDHGSHVCFQLFCEAQGKPIQWNLVLSDTKVDDGPQPLILQVDGVNKAAMILHPHATDPAYDYRRDYDPDQDEHIFRRLSRGAGGVIYFGVGHQQISHAMSLKGSARALAQVETLCATKEKPQHMPKVDPTPDTPKIADRHLTAVEVRDMLVGRELSWKNDSGSAITTYAPNGSYTGQLEGTDYKRKTRGEWWLIDNGNICWKDGGATGCFQFRYVSGDLYAYRVDGGANLELGLVQIGN